MADDIVSKIMGMSDPLVVEVLERIEEHMKRGADAAERTSEQLAALIEMIDTGETPTPTTSLTGPRAQCVPMATIDDTVRLFVAKRCQLDDAGKVTGGDLYRAYRDWSIGMGVPQLTSTAFGRVLTQIGIGRLKSNGVIVRTGLSLRPLREVQGQLDGDSP